MPNKLKSKRRLEKEWIEKLHERVKRETPSRDELGMGTLKPQDVEKPP